MQTLRRPKVRDQVADRIQWYVVQQQPGSGDRLPTETEFAAWFGIRRLTLREVTKVPGFLAIIESKTGVGLTVGRIDMPRFIVSLSFHTGLPEADPQLLSDSRVTLETAVLTHVSRWMTDDPAIETRLRERVEQFRSVRNLNNGIELDILFHRSLLNASRPQPLVALGHLRHICYQRFCESMMMAARKVGVKSHQLIVDELANGHVKAATAKIRKHIQSHKEQCP